MNCSFIMFHPCFIEATVFPPGLCRQPLILGLLPLTLGYGRRRAGQMRHRLGRSTLAHLQRTSAIRMIYSSCIDVMIILQTSLPKTLLSGILWRNYYTPQSLSNLPHSDAAWVAEAPADWLCTFLASNGSVLPHVPRFSLDAHLMVENRKGGKFSFELSSQVPRKLD